MNRLYIYIYRKGVNKTKSIETRKAGSNAMLYLCMLFLNSGIIDS